MERFDWKLSHEKRSYRRHEQMRRRVKWSKEQMSYWR